MYPFYIPPEWYEALGPAAVAVPLPPPKKSKKKEVAPPPNTPSPEDVYWTGVPPVAVTTAPPLARIPPPPAVIAPPRPEEAKPPSRLKAMLPDLAMAAATVAQRMAQPRQVGESGMMAATQALVQGYNTLAQLQWMRYAQQMAQRQQQLQELKTLADIGRTQAETRKTHQEAEAVMPKVEIERMKAQSTVKQADVAEGRLKVYEKQVEGQLQLKGKELEIEETKVANQAAAKQQELALKEREVAAMEKNIESLVRDRASRAEIDKAKLKLEQARVELDRIRTDAYVLTAQAKVLEAASGGVPPEKLRANLYGKILDHLPPEASKKDVVEFVRIADMLVDTYARSQKGQSAQPVASPPSEKGARLVQPSSGEYVRAIETSNGEVYELRRDGQWFRTR